MRSPAIRMPTLLRATSARPSIRRPAFTRIGWSGVGVWATSAVRSARATISGNECVIARLLRVARGESPPERGPVKALKLEQEVLMATTVTPPERTVSADEAREVAEAAREQGWAAPSFVRDLFLGRLRLDLVHPYPEQDAEEVRRAQPFLERLPPGPRAHPTPPPPPAAGGGPR